MSTLHVTTGRSSRIHLLRRGLLCVAALAAIWAVVISVSGGFVLDVGWLRLSSRAWRNPFLIALLSLAGACALASSGARARTLRDDWRAIEDALFPQWHLELNERHARALALASVLALSVGVLWLGLAHGALVAGGADSYGYVSQARLWTNGTLRVEQPFLDNPPGGIPQEALVPLGYRLPPTRDALVPFYAPGLPMTMALFERVGGADAVYLVMPLLAALTVWTTFALGVSVGGTAVGIAAALLLATSPTFGFQLTHAPMSDIPAMAWWTLALVLAARGGGSSAVLSGLATSAAVLTRPNLVPLAIVPAALLCWLPTALRMNVPSARAGSTELGGLRSVKPLLLFAAGTAPGVLMVAILNDYWYGSPLESGYGPLGGIFLRWDHFWPNVVRYPTWLRESQGVLVFAAAAAPLLLWRRGHRDSTATLTDRRAALLACVAFIALTYACYAFYLPFDGWWTLRFLLPAFPALFVLTSAALLHLGARLPSRTRAIAGPVLIGLMLLHATGFSIEQVAYDSRPELRFAAIGRHIAGHFPERTAFLSMLHSGSIRHYSGRMTIRYDWIPEDRLLPAIEDLQRRGFTPYIVVDDEEREDFVRRFGQISPVGRPDAAPVARLHGVSIYTAR